MTYFWTIEKYNKQDYFAWELNLSLLKNQTNNYFKNKIAYNQANLWNNSICTIIAWVWILSNYFDKEFTKEEIFNLVDIAKTETPPFVDWKGWFLYKAVDLNRQQWNKNNPDNQIITYRVDTFSDLFYDLLKKGYHLQTWFSVDRQYRQDKKDNCSIDWSVKGSWLWNIWHSIYIWIDNWKTYVIDSYKWAWCNKYSLDLPIEKLKKFFFRNSYAFIPKKNIMTQLEKDIADIELALKLQITYNKQTLEDIKKWNYTTDVKMFLWDVRTYKLIMQKLNHCK